MAVAGGGRRRAGELGLQALPAGRSRPGTGLAAPYRQPASPAAATAAPSGATLPPPACSSTQGAPRSSATATTSSQSDRMPTLPIPGRAEPRSTPPWCAQRQVGRARGPVALLLLLPPTAATPPNQPTERRPICGSRRTSTLFLVTWRRTATAGGRAGRQWALAAHPDPHLSPPPHDDAPPHTPPRVAKTAAVTRRLRVAHEVKAFWCVESSAIPVG